MFNYKLWLLLCVLIIPFGAYSQSTDTIKGEVLVQNAEGEITAVPGANIYWIGTTAGTTSDDEGEFVISREAGTDLLVISFVGYGKDTVSTAGQSFLSVMFSEGETLKAVEVEYERRTTEISFLDPVHTTTITEEELGKAACCNLSESFETNPSVDVSFTDAVTGTKQIRMLGLAGPYTQITRELIPFADGLNANYGLTFIPGTWIESIQVMKGTGSVANGYEGMTGQINVELKKPSSPEKLYLNLYGNQEGASEFNLVNTWKVSDRWSMANLAHGHIQHFAVDHNNDGFKDVPTGNQLNFIHRWKYTDPKGVHFQVGVNALMDSKDGGEIEEAHNGQSQSGHEPYTTMIDNQRLELWAKAGYVFPEKAHRSLGMQLSGIYHDLNTGFGNFSSPGEDGTAYSSQERRFYGNWMYQSIISNTDHQFKTGASFRYRSMTEFLNGAPMENEEIVPGGFFEYTFSHLEEFSLVAGIRGDYHNQYGFFATPRLHVRYAVSENTVLRLNGGRGFRVPYFYAENTSLFATSREILLTEELLPEVSWNMGISLAHDFRVFFRRGTLQLDYYRTQFENKVIVDLDQSARKAIAYNLDGISYANSFSAQVDYELLENLDMRLAYRWYDVKSTFHGQVMQQPFVASQRAFANFGYTTGNDWLFDYTVSWFGQQRVPSTAENPEVYQRPSTSDDYFRMNAQVTKKWKNGLDIYLGMENILDTRQENPIIAADDPYGDYFDSSLIWGPITGRMVYAGLRFKIPCKD